MKRVLFFSYYFPPSSGGGIQRSVAFVRYLPQYNFEPIVVTADGGYSQISAVNETLVQSLSNVRIDKIRTTRADAIRKKIMQSFIVKFFPHGQAQYEWWTRRALSVCEKILNEEKIDVIYTTASPYASARIGLKLHEKYNIPWVMDLRDPWAIDDIREYKTYLYYRADMKDMRKACGTASAVIMNTKSAKIQLLKSFPELDQEKIFHIPNGFDDDIVKSEEKNVTGNKGKKPFILAHAGGFTTHLGVFTDAVTRRLIGVKNNSLRFALKDLLLYRPGNPNLLCRSPYYLLNAIKKLIDSGQLIRRDIQILFIGQLSEYDEKIIDELNLGSIIVKTGYVPYEKSIELLYSADAVLLTQHRSSAENGPLSVPGKTFELLKIGKPMLALVPPGDAREIIEKSGIGVVCDPDNISQIKTGLLQLMRNSEELSRKANWDYINRFSRKSLTAKLANVLGFSIERDDGVKKPSQ